MVRSSAAPAYLLSWEFNVNAKAQAKQTHSRYKLVPHSSVNPSLHSFRILRQIGAVCAGTGLSELQPGTLLKLPASDPQAGPSSAAIAASDARRSRHGPHKGIVAVKVQYPNAYPTMALDLGNVKTAAAFLQKTELKFDLTSAVKELAKQIKLEFDFSREAKIMDDISSQLQVSAQSLDGTASVDLDRCRQSTFCCRWVLEDTIMLEA